MNELSSDPVVAENSYVPTIQDAFGAINMLAEELDGLTRRIAAQDEEIADLRQDIAAKDVAS